MARAEDPEFMVLGWGPGSFTDHRTDHTIEVDVCLSLHQIIDCDSASVACIEIHGDGATITMELTDADIQKLHAVLATHLPAP